MLDIRLTHAHQTVKVGWGDMTWHRITLFNGGVLHELEDDVLQVL
jgi:hypothetical protein